MEPLLLSLGDPLLHLIIEQLPNRARRQLRCVSRRLRGLVDEHLTEINLEDRGTIYSSLFVNWTRFPNVKSLKITRLTVDAAEALASVGWTQLETVDIREIHGFVGDFELNVAARAANSMVGLRGLRRLTLCGDGGRHMAPQTLQAIGSVCPSLESLNFNQHTFTRRYEPSQRLFLSLAEGRPPAALPHLRTLSIPGSAFESRSFHDFAAVNWEALEELQMNGSTLASLFRSAPRWPRLKVLILVRLNTVEDMAAVFNADIPMLEELCMTDAAGVGPGAGAVLRRCTQWPNLRDLVLSSALCDALELETFMEVTLARLESIQMSFTFADDALVVMGENAHRWPALSQLELYASGDFRDDGSVLAIDKFKGLEQLAICSSSSVVYDIGRLPADAQLRSSLRTLSLLVPAEEIDDRKGIVSAIIFENSWDRLEELSIDTFIVDTRAAAALSAAVQQGRLPRLRVLQLSSCEISVSAMRALFSAPYPQLKELDLSDSELAPGAAAVLAQSATFFPKLRYFILSELESKIHLDLEPKGLETLLTAPWPDSLERVVIEALPDWGGYSMEKWLQVDAPGWEAVITEEGMGEKYVKYVRRRF